MNKEKEKKITPAEYFNTLKELKETNTDSSLEKFYNASLALLNKYKMFGQKKMMKKLMFIVECVPKEKQLLDMGIDTFIYKDDIEEYINTVEGRAVKIIEMEEYPREIPDEFIDVVAQTCEIFDKFFILFTDYNGKEEKRVAKERRDKDPILLGVFNKDSILNDRFYYLGDWVDEYCDLTLEKLLEEAGDNISKMIRTPLNKKELMDECKRITESNNKFTINYSNFNNSSITSSVANPVVRFIEE